MESPFVILTIKGKELLVVSANCQGLQNKQKRRDMIDYFEKSNASIICFQDTHWTSKDEQIVKSLWKGDCILNGNSSNSRGVAILLNTNFEYKILKISKDDEGNMITLDLVMGDISLKLINLYAPNRDSPLFFEKVKEIMESNTQTYTMILGDLNLVLDPSLDSDQYKHVNNPKSRNVLLHIMNVFNLVDSFRLTHPSARRFTWRRKNPTRQARLDYFLVTRAMHDIITDCSINPSYRSDHSSIQMKVLLNNFDRGRGLWKFNCSLLKDKCYVEMINSIIQEEKEKYAIPIYSLDYLIKVPNDSIQFTVDDGQFLELLLLRIRGETIKFASHKKKTDSKVENKLKNEIKILEESQDASASTILEHKKRN